MNTIFAAKVKVPSPSLAAGPYPLDNLGHEHSALDALVEL